MRRFPCPRDGLRSFLEGLDSYVILRNHDVWSNFERGGDLDVLVRDQRAAEHSLLRNLGRPLLTIRRAYVTEYVFSWGHVDICTTLAWRGAEYLRTTTILQGRSTSELGFHQPSLAQEAVASWFASLLFGGFFKERYCDIIVRAARDDAEEFRQLLRDAAGPHWGERLWQAAVNGQPARSTDWTRQVRRAVWWRAFRRDPPRTVRAWIEHWRTEFRLRLRPPVPWCLLLGPDGSGKSAVLAQLRERFATAGIIPVHSVHWRPGLLWPGNHKGPVTDPHGRPPRAALLSVLQLGFLFLDWGLGYVKQLVHLRAKGWLVLCDRHYLDILVDPKRYRYGGPRWVARYIGHLIPTPDLVIVLDAPPTVLLERKQEVAPDEIARQRLAYRTLVEHRAGGRVVDASRELARVVDEVETIIYEYINAETEADAGGFETPLKENSRA